MGALGLCGEVTGRKSRLAGGDVARYKGEGGAREKGETRGELRGDDAVLSSALEKMKAVSVRLRWYRLNGLPVREDPGLVGLCDVDDSCLKNSLGFMERWDTNTAASAAFSMDSLLLRRALMSSSCSICCCSHLNFSFLRNASSCSACFLLCSSIICSFSFIFLSLSSASFRSFKTLSLSSRRLSSAARLLSSSFLCSSSRSARAQKESLFISLISIAALVFL